MENNAINLQPTPTPVIPVAPQKKRNGMLFFTIFFAILALGLGGYLVYHFVTVSHDAGTKPSGDDNTSTITDETEVKVKNMLGLIADAIPNRNVTAYVYDSKSPDLVLEEIGTMTPADKSYGILYELYGDEAYQSVYNTIVSKLGSMGMTKKVVSEEIPFYVWEGDYYIGNDVTCSITSSHYMSDYKDIYVICSHNSWLLDETKTLVTELSTAYKEKSGEYPVAIYVRGREIKDSSVSPYQTISVAMHNAAGLFYRVSPDAEWQYFAMAQDSLECKEYNTEDLRKAFAGDRCYDSYNTGVESTVKP